MLHADAQPLPGYPEPYGLLSAVLIDGTNEWRWEMDPDLPEEALVWQAYPGGHSIGGIMLHIISVEIGWFERYVLGLDRDPEESALLMVEAFDVDEWQWPTPPRRPLSWYFDLHDRIRARTLDGIRGWPDADVSIIRGDRSRTPRWVLGHVIQHEAYHGGQAVLLQRLWQLKSKGSA